MASSSAVPLSPGSYFAELQSLQSANASGVIDKETFECYKSQLDKLRRAQNAGVSQILRDIDYKEHPSAECGHARGFRSISQQGGVELQELGPGRESPLTFVRSSGAAVRHLMSSPAGFVQMSQDSDTDSPALRPANGGQEIDLDNEEEDQDGVGQFKVVTEEENGSNLIETFINTFM